MLAKKKKIEKKWEDINLSDYHQRTYYILAKVPSEACIKTKSSATLSFCDTQTLDGVPVCCLSYKAL